MHYITWWALFVLCHSMDIHFVRNPSKEEVRTEGGVGLVKAYTTGGHNSPHRSGWGSGKSVHYCLFLTYGGQNLRIQGERGLKNGKIFGRPSWMVPYHKNTSITQVKNTYNLRQYWIIPQRPASQWMAGRWMVNSRALAGEWPVDVRALAGN